MKLKGVAAFLSLVLLLPFISAQFTLSSVFSYVDSQSIFIIVTFGVLGLLLKVILDRFPAFRGTTAGIMSLLLSLGATWGINKWINVNSFFYGIGFSGDISAYLVMALIVIFIISLFIFKWKAPLILGALLILMALFTDLVAEESLVLFAGIIFIMIGLIWAFLSHRRKKKEEDILAGNAVSPAAPVSNSASSPAKQVVYQQRQRSLYDLKQKYMAYLFYYNRRGLTKHERERILKAMNIILDYAKKVGVSKNEFLSSKIGGSNAKAPWDLRPPFDG
jgi:hypothetical protein